jgi:dTDP-4-dehydrorhamnose 3,5-epimerase
VIVADTALPEVKLLTPRVFGDDRGFFLESWNARVFADAGLDMPFVQDNHSRSARGVLRGLHYQLNNPQGKLVRVTQGAVFDVAVDIRRASPNFGRWTGHELSGDNKQMLWIPPGFAHGFLVLSYSADFLYKCTTLYDPPSDRSLAWNDPDIGIAWPLGGMLPLLSGKDAAAARLTDAEVFA